MRLTESHVCMFLPSQIIEAVQYKMEERYASAKTIPGTRSYHEFVPLNNGEIGLKRISDQEHFDSVFSFVPKRDQETNVIAEIQIGQFITCAYDNTPWIGNITEIDSDHRDVLIKFMHPSFPARSFFWPERDDSCYVPESNILVVLTPPPSTSSARQYVLEDRVKQTVAEIWQLFQ